MRGLRLFLALLGAFCWLIAPGVSAKPAAAEKADVRVLIDISGSMKQNDPHNLRRPALRLLVGLLPKDTRAGVWTFGQYVNMQIPLGQVDRGWKYKARESSKKIGSPGQFTNIEDALKRATEDWSGAPGKFRRSVILLTDGMVDISKAEAKNQASRQRVLQTILPRLQKLGAVIHTIALSKNADHELMRELAKGTGGWYEQVENADQLQVVFLRIFEKVGKPDAVPLKDNKFTIDNSITEATVLVFHSPDAQATQLIPPDGQAFGANNAPSSVSWHRDEGYDMLTISDPQAGEWRIRAEIDPDNRVMVVTDLKMLTSDLPNRLLVGQSLPLEVSFTDHGRQIRKKSFLKVVSVTATQYVDGNETEPRPLLDDGTGEGSAGDGVFSLGFGGESLQRGMGELVIDARSNTFVREKRMTYEVVPPIELLVTPGESNGILRVSLRPDEKLVKVDSVEVRTWLEDRAGKNFPLAMSRGPDGLSMAEIDINSFHGMRKIFVEATGSTLQGDLLDYLDSSVEVEGIKPLEEKPQLVQPEPAPIAQVEPQAKDLVEPKAEPPTEEPLPVTAAEETPEEDDWVSLSIWFGLANLLVLLLVGGLFWWFRRSNQKSLVTLVEEAPPVSPEKEEAKEKAA